MRAAHRLRWIREGGPGTVGGVRQPQPKNTEHKMKTYMIKATGSTEYGTSVVTLFLNFSPTLEQVNALGSADRQADFRAHHVSVVML